MTNKTRLKVIMIHSASPEPIDAIVNKWLISQENISVRDIKALHTPDEKFYKDIIYITYDLPNDENH